MPTTGKGPQPRKTLVYLKREEVFRYITRHPFTCVEYIQFRRKETEVTEKPDANLKKFKAPYFPQPAEGSRFVQYFNCADRKPGETHPL